jgi:ABC-type oligopeptide transport system ATPase subunit
MPQQTKIFRVFVSSTFTDMQKERSILQREAFPRLEKYCEEKGARFQAVDLRWGVNEESQLNQKTLQICFNEIARCQKISPKPNFVILLGEKYGWQPIPEIIPGEEMDEILKVLSEADRKLINQCYWLDENAVPAEYVLQPRSEEHKEYSSWEPIENLVRDVLRKVVDTLSFTSQQKLKYFASATHQEIIRGALNTPEGIESPEKHVFAFSRIISGLPQDKSAKGFIDLVDGQSDKTSYERLDELKSELQEKLGIDHFEKYTGEWKDGSLFIEEKDLKKFNDDVHDKIKAVISEQLANVVDKDEIMLETRLHGEFKTKLTEHFCGRVETLQMLNSYLNVPSEKRVLAMVGESGSGKSSVMAELVKQAETNKNGQLIVYRFIGTSSRSSNIISLFQSICGQIARAYNTTIEVIAGEGRDKALYDLNGLTEILKKCLALATPEKPILLFLDALDQLSDSDNARSLYWLPRELPQNTRMIVSALPELKPQLNNHFQIDLPLLPVEEASTILERWLKAVSRKLNYEQQKEVLDKFSLTGLPIFLKLAFERAKKWNSYTELKEYTLQEDVKGIINSFIDMLEDEHTDDFVRDVICLMLCGRYQGLAENEILEIFAFDKDLWQQFLNRAHEDHRNELVNMKEGLEKDKKFMKIPIVVWSRLYLDLEPYLTERDADGVPIITFFHRQFNEVLMERYELKGVTVKE